MDAEYDIWVPFEQFSCQRCLQHLDRNFLMLSLEGVKVHLRKEHPHVKVNYACRLCRQKRGPKLHAIQVHTGKCRGEQALVQLDFPCEECGASSRSQRGLSIHEVTQHPERRDVARAEAAQQPARPRAPRAGTVFTENEVQVMLECEVTYYGHKTVAKMMEPHLSGKSNEQIRNKRRLTSCKTARDEFLAAHLGAVGGAPEPAEQEQVGEIDGRQDELPQAAEVEERAASPPVIVVEEAQLENVAEEPEHGATPEPQPEIELETISISDDEPAVEEIASPPETPDVEVQPAPTQVASLVDDSIVIEDVVVPPAAGEEPQIDEVVSAWRQRIVTSVLSREMPRHVRSFPVDTAMGWKVVSSASPELHVSACHGPGPEELRQTKKTSRACKMVRPEFSRQVGRGLHRQHYCRMITALRMRTNSCANRVAMNRVGPVPDLDCRQCGTQLETLGHILGMCRYTKPSRIRRHDEICDLIVQEVQKQGREVAVTVEPPTMVVPRGRNLKPDLVIQRQGRVLVVDVTVRHEDGNNLAMGHNDKMRKYGQLLGTRGAMPRKTIQGLQKLGITTKGVYKTISLIALRSSIEIYHDYMDYNGLSVGTLGSPPDD
ncbi:unnamed protein product [Phaedon cochleariae]|uniref:C2H2-type domain-containing protein n=1 Tax=Phaedon cochleariae TaxID=80249 RepID=A0A9N9SL48_PHACE|nr:unnamed protein product [Phaedon cochleariae]